MGLTPRKRYAQITLALFSVLLSFIVFDLLGRTLYDLRSLVRPTPIYKNQWPTDARVSRFDANVHFVGEIVGGLVLMRPGSPSVERRIEFITDANGFRNRPEALRRENPLILLGDSFAAGSSTTQDETLSASLEHEFGIPNYNLSVGGQGPWHEYMTLQYAYDQIPKTRTATIGWLLFEGNDLEDRYYEDLTPNPNGWLDRLSVRINTFVKRSPVKQSIERLLFRPEGSVPAPVLVVPRAGRELLFYAPYIGHLNRTVEQLRSHPNINKFAVVFDEMCRFATTNHHRLIVVLVPSKAQVYEGVLRGHDRPTARSGASALSRSIRALATSRAVEYVDLLPYFQQRAESLHRESGAYLYWTDDTHWNAAGQKLAARKIAEAYRASMPPVVGHKSEPIKQAQLKSPMPGSRNFLRPDTSSVTGPVQF